MKYQISVNQAGVVAAGLHTRTDLIDWALLSHIYGWQANSRAHRRGDMVWLNFKRLMSDMPLLGLNTKGPVSRRIAKLRDLGLLETEQSDDKRLYVKTTEYYQEVAEYRVSEGKHVLPQGNEGVSQKKHVFPTGNRVFPQGNEGVSQKKHSKENLEKKTKKGADSAEEKTGHGIIDDDSRAGMQRFVTLGNQILDGGEQN